MLEGAGQESESPLKRVVQNKGAAGVDGQKAEQYLRESPHRLEQVQDMLRKGRYTPQPVKRVWIPKLGSKELRPRECRRWRIASCKRRCET